MLQSGGASTGAERGRPMSSIQVMRFETKARLADNVQLAQHTDGTTRPETAVDAALVAAHDPANPAAVVHLAGVGMRVARDAVRAATVGRPARGRPPKECLVIVFAGPSAYDAAECWEPARELSWYEAIRDAERELIGPNSLIVTSDAHRDETAPHTQSLVIPFDSRGRMGWCHVRDEACVRLRPVVKALREKAQADLDERRAAGEELPDLPQPSTKSRYGILQDFLYYRVNRAFGLERGEVGSQAKHKQIDRQQASARAAKRARAETERLQAEAEQRARVANERAEAAEKIAGELEPRCSQLVSDVEKLEPEVADLRRAREDEQALAARWAVGKGAVRAAKIRDRHAGQVRDAQAEAREQLRLRRVAEDSLSTVAEKLEAAQGAQTRAEKTAADETALLAKRDAELADVKDENKRLGNYLAYAEDRVRTLTAELEQVVAREAAAVAAAFRSGFERARAVLDAVGYTPGSQVAQILGSARAGLDSSPAARDRGEPGPVRERD